MARSRFYKRFIRPVKHSLGFLVLRFIVFIFRLLPFPFALWLGSLSAVIVSCFDKKGKDNCVININIASELYPEIKKLSPRQVYRSWGENLVVMLRHRSDISSGRLKVEFEGKELFDKYYNEGKGVIAITGHIGAFELIPSVLSTLGYRVSVVGRRLFDKRFDNLLVKMREGNGVVNVSSDESARVLLKLLSGGYSLGILADMNTKSVTSEPSAFFGHTAPTVTGPCSLARATGHVLLPIAVVRRSYHSYSIICHNPVIINRTDDKKADISDALVLMNAAIERLILESPSEWMWFHKRY